MKKQKRLRLKMSKNKRLLFVFILLNVLSISCDNPFSSEPEEAKFEIVSTSKSTTSYGSPSVLVTVKNVGNATGYNVACKIYAKKGNTIIATADAFFAGLGNIKPGETTQDEAVFFDLKSHNDYSDLKYELSWLKS